MKNRVLVVDDDQSECDLLEATLGRLECEVTSTTSPLVALERVAQEKFDVIITDLGMTELDGLELCERILGTTPDVPVIVVTGQGSMHTAIAAMRAGAYDFITKPVSSDVLGLSVSRAAQHRRLNSEVKRLRDAAVTSTEVDGTLVGDSPSMVRVRDLIERVGASDASVLIHGETGTGKELVARAVHAASAQKDGPFVAINCAAVPANLLESELFGHARGAFTDAKGARQGLFVKASGGTLFLDEIGEMPLEMQAKLLRALQERTVRPVGSNEEIGFTARIVTATHRDIEADVEKGRFREDLYYRVNVVKIDVPPLRERGGDVVVLAMRFLARFAARSGKGALSISPQAAQKLLAYSWPGNVRELENAIERAVALARFDHLTVADLPDKVRAYRPDRFLIAVDGKEEIMTLEEIDRRYILRVLALLGGNKARTAEVLGVDRRTLYRRLDKYAGKGESSGQEGAEGGEAGDDLGSIQ